jgi:osmoprotectant transport system substrate-binding protein
MKKIYLNKHIFSTKPTTLSVSICVHLWFIKLPSTLAHHIVKNLKFSLLSFLIAFTIISCQSSTQSSSGDIVIGSKLFTEQIILGELIAQHIETQTDLKVGRQLGLQGTLICHEALKAGKIDAYVEYTGTALSAVLGQKQTVNNPAKVYQQVKQEYAEKFNLEVMKSLGFENTFAMIIRGEDAQKFNIQTLSEAAQYTPQWQPGFGYEFVERADGFLGLSQTYHLKFGKRPKLMDLGLMYRALINQQVDMVAGNSTDGLIQKFGLFILKDDKQYFPPYEATPIVRQETLKKYPQLKPALQQLEGLISPEEIQNMNYQVDGELRKVETVVREFLQKKGLG